LCGRKVVFVPHFHLYPYKRVWRDWYDRTIGRFFFNCSNHVVVFTEYTRQQLLKYGVKPEKLCVVSHVARPDMFTCSSAQRPGSLLRQAGITGNPLLLGVGQLIERKGWEYTVRCLPAIVARFPDAQLLIAGPSQPAEPDFRRSLLRLANDLKVADHLHIVQDNAPEFILDAYRSATILTHPSFVESFGMVLLEAMTAGLPVVAHNGTGIPCIIEDGETGYVVDVRDEPQYTGLLLALLGDPQLRQRMGEAGKKRAETYFSQARSAETLCKIFAELMPLHSSVSKSIEA
jgi:phosphatidylinositol alpha-1,6-mannosyltransferase